MKPWDVVSSRVTFEDPYLKIRSDTCRRDDGRIIDPYHVIESTTWVCVVALTPGDEVVLVREYRHGAGAIVVGLPGGASDVDDPSVEAAARRELMEETGYACETLREVGRAYANWANQSNEIAYFLGVGAHKAGPQQLDPNEEIEVLTRPWADYAAQDHDGPSHTHHVAAVFYAERFLRDRN